MYLASIHIENFKGIKELDVSFEQKINVVIGENGCCKTALIDAIRILYNLGNPKRDFYVTNEDFYTDGKTGIQSKKITISYSFRGLTNSEKGALIEYLVVSPTDPNEDFASITIGYELRDKGYPKFTYFTGFVEEQRADQGTFDIFQHYYLGALRNSTTDLLNIKNNVLGSVISRLVERSNTSEEFRKIIKDANTALLARDEVKNTRNGVNTHLDNIFKITKDNQIGVRIEESSRIESILNVIKPYLPFDKATLESDGFNLWQNSLGFNNLIYIAIILGDINERIKDNPNQHFVLLIEEPEAHLHPQLQLNLYNFLKAAGAPRNCQLFITTHSPTLTSKIELDNIIRLQQNAVNIGNCFRARESEKVIEQSSKKLVLTDADFENRKNQLERFLDVTKCQLFYAQSILFVEGISEKLLVSSFAKFINQNLEDNRSELISVEGISFYAFIHLFNSADPAKRLSQNVAIITDDDRLSKIKYSFKNLIKKNYSNLHKYHSELIGSFPVNRIGNLKSTIKQNPSTIKVFTAFKTLEYEIALANVSDAKSDFEKNFLIQFISKSNPAYYAEIKKFVESISTPTFSLPEKQKIAILVWKALPSKAEFAQSFSLEIEKSMEKKEVLEFKVPKYLAKAINYATS